MSLLFSELTAKLREKIVRKKSGKIINWLVASNQARHAHFGDSAYLLEPNLKEGRGGLRDYHTILWIARIEFDLKHPRDLEYFGRLSHAEFQTLRESLMFIWRVRNQLHLLCGRKYDRLHFENQIKLAEIFKFRKKNGQQPVERFLGELHGRMEFLKLQHLRFLHDLGLEKVRKRKRKSSKASNVEGLNVTDSGRLDFPEPEEILKQPELLVKIFEESTRLEVPLSAESRRLVEEFGHLVNKKFRSSQTAIKSFEHVLVTHAPTFNVLNEMLNTGFLEKFIPAFKHIVNRIQYDEYHLYPVDKHVLRTVFTIKNFGSKENKSEPLCREIYRALKNKRLLLWAALLHDIGKGDPSGGHALRGTEIAARTLAEKGFNPKEIETVAFLVREHLLLAETATRRDIHDEETAIFCARRIKNIRRLKMLYLLTVADSMSTGPAAWNDWKSNLLRDFFFRLLNVLEKGNLATAESVKIITKKRETIINASRGEKQRKAREALFDSMSPRYRLYMPAGDILAHIGLFHDLGTDDFIWKISPSEDNQLRTLTICAQDRPGLISKIAGVLTANNINILDVQAFTWKNNIALDLFQVTPPPDQVFEDEKWKRAHSDLERALAGKLDLEAAIRKRTSTKRSAVFSASGRPLEINVDNTSSSFFTIVEVIAYDLPGLLFSITDALYRCELNIWVAKIATKADQVVDVFYVRDLHGEKVDQIEQVEAVKRAILKNLPANT